MKLVAIYKTCHAILKDAGAVAWQRVGSQSLIYSSITADDLIHAFCAMNSNDSLKNFPTKR